MIVGVPREVKDRENRVSTTPGGIHEFISWGHRVIIERGAGAGGGFSDREYERAGAELVDAHGEVFGLAEMIVKVKEPVSADYDLLRPNHLLFAYLHLAAEEPQTRALMRDCVQVLAYESVQAENESLPVLRPMKAVVVRTSIRFGAHHIDPTLAKCIDVLNGIVTYEAVESAFALPDQPWQAVA